MKKITLVLLVLLSFTLYAQNDEKAVIDSIEKSFTYQHGKIALKDGIGEITIPQGFKYLDPKQAEHVLVDMWGNPKSENITLGLILPENQGITDAKGYVFNIQYDEIGYVKDDDADEINYDELLTQMKADSEKENNERRETGYDPVEIIGWAAKPFYDKEHKVLHWAKELQFGDESLHTLNYNIRVLGRKGVLVLNAIASMPELPLVQKDIHKVLNIVKFNDGYKYTDFNPSVDEVAAWTIGGLVAGKILAKVGLFAVLLKFGKFIVIGAIGLVTALFKKFKRKKENEDELLPVADTTSTTDTSHAENHEI